MQRKLILRHLRFIFPIGLAILFVSSPTCAEDVYSVDLVTPSYMEANTVLPLTGDGNNLEVPLPFSFPFFQKAYTSAFVSTDGFLSFVKGYVAPKNTPLTSLPAPGIPNGAIFAFWDDLNVDPLASVRKELVGTAPNRQFVIEWRNVTFYNYNFKVRVDFEIVLHENGVILLQYRNIADEGREKGNSATIGLVDEAGSSAVQYGPTTSGSPILGVGESAIRFAHLTKSVAVDIKPRVCPNRLNVDNHGELHVAILGTPDFDVKTVDPNTVTLGGVAVLSKQEDPVGTKKRMKLIASKHHHRGWSLRDVGTPFAPFLGKTDRHQCNELGPDGHLDIVFNFDTQAIADSLGNVEDHEVITLQLRGNLRDGTEIIGEDVVIIREEGKHHRWARGHDKDRDYGHDRDRD